MDSSDDALWFLGDLSDSWVVSIAGELARCAGIVQVHCPGDLPVRPFGRDQRPRLMIIHRHRFTAVDAQRLREYREPSAPGAGLAIILCVSPFVRYEELERWSGLADLVISEATAADVLPRQVARLFRERDDRTTRADPPRFRIEVAGDNHDLCRALAEACELAGYRVFPPGQRETRAAASLAASPPSAAERILTIWDAPILEPDWSERLERLARTNGPVIALIGFADRENVTLAKARGAVACLELPYDVDDLIDVIDRTARSLAPERWPVPMRTDPPHPLPPPSRRRKVPRDSSAWSDRDGKPKVV